MEYTSNLNLKKPGQNDNYNVDDDNYNAEIIDVEIANRVVKVTGKGLSAEDYSTADKLKLFIASTTFINTSANDSYTFDIPGISSYSDLVGIPLKFSQTVSNTGGCSLNVSSLGAKAIYKDVLVALDTGDILANTITTVIYDGTNFQIQKTCNLVNTTKTQTLMNKTLISPKVTSQSNIGDENGNELIKFPVTVVNAINEVTIENAIAGQAPHIKASGGDLDIPLHLEGKGTGGVLLNGVDVNASLADMVHKTVGSTIYSYKNLGGAF